MDSIIFKQLSGYVLTQQHKKSAVSADLNTLLGYKIIVLHVLSSLIVVIKSVEL